MGIANPANAHLYGYGGAMLEEDFALPIMDDLPEVSLYIDKGSDGMFGVGDRILFFAQGALSFRAKESSPHFERIQNPYSTCGYYFLTESNSPGREMNPSESLSDSSTDVTSFNDYALHETEIASVANTGRELFGESFSYSVSQTFPIPSVDVAAQEAALEFRFVAKAPTRTPIAVEIGDKTATFYLESSSPDNSYEKARGVVGSIRFTPEEHSTLAAKLTYGKSGHSNARLDYLLLNYKRQLRLSGAFTLFRTSDPALIGKHVRYRIADTSPTSLVWDLTERINPTLVAAQHAAGITSFVGRNRYLARRLQTEYAVVDPRGDFPKPEVVGRVKSQNLHGLGACDMVIIAPSAFIDQAERLAEFHRQTDGLRVEVVGSEAIYNEFSSGAPDATAYRRLMKMLFDRAAQTTDRPRYLLLFGDGAFDNRFLTAGWSDLQKQNSLLTYQSVGSLVETDSYTSDDYFGLLEDGEGVDPGMESLDLGIGRLPVITLQEAADVVDKIITYAANREPGSWKNQVAFVGDDGDGNIHLSQADELAQYVVNAHKTFVVHKVFLDAFKKETTSSGSRYPDVNKQLLDKLRSGLLILDYVGHGTSSHWAVEQVMTSDMIRGLQHTWLPLWVTATCDFSRFDHYAISAGEYALLNPRGGAIALVSTSRVVFSGPNHNLNRQFIHHILNTDLSRGYRLGDAMMATKRALGNDNNKLNFTLLGDPALKLNFPEQQARVTEVNGFWAGGEPEQLKAFQQVTFAGDLLHADGTSDPSFNGVVRVAIYDSEEDFTTLDNDQTGVPFAYRDRRRVLFSGQDSVRSGAFSIRFTVPKNISYSNLQGRTNLYAFTSTGKEAKGYFDNYIVGGSEMDEGSSDKQPLIKSIYLNAPHVANGGVVNDSPVLFVELEDEFGIHVSGNGIGHDLMVRIDDSPLTTYILNDYFEPTIGQVGSGRVAFRIPSLTDGAHRLLFRAWNVMGNSASQTIDFTVERGAAPHLYELYVDRNPATDGVNFYLRHDRPGIEMEVSIEVFSVTGTMVWSHCERSLSDRFDAAPIRWNLTSSDGNLVSSGFYLYRGTIATPTGEYATETRKLIVATP